MSEEVGPKKFGTFAGVYVPTLLTILGVIMYLRLGWVMGNAGLVGGLLIVTLAFVITTATGLAMSSFTTNIRIGAGGAYSIISQSLGLEVGGSVGIPLYLAQTMAVALYIFGFREGWQFLFPGHPSLLVDLLVFLAIVGIAYKSAQFAFRIQYVILGIVGLSLVSVAIAAFTGSMENSLAEVSWWGSFEGEPPEFTGTTFWIVFAVFFPAATGIMAGLNLSGDLRNPRMGIPVGTLAAIATAYIIYVALAFWIVLSATQEELLANYTIMADKAWLGSYFVLAGILGATFSSALASIVGAPRILQALGTHNVLPRGEWLSTRRPDGEPQNAMVVTAGIVLLALALRDLNAIAPLITMFFLITYMMINVVVFFEQSLDLVSFRPLLRIPMVVSLVGLVGCLFAMFIINPVFSLISLTLVAGAYALMARRTLNAPYGDVRSGMFISIAEWAAKKVWELPTRQERAWKPNFLVAVQDPEALRGSFLFLQDLTFPKGSVQLVGLYPRGESSRMEAQLESLAQDFRGRRVFANWIALESETFNQGLLSGIQSSRGSFPRPNIVFLRMPAKAEEMENYERVIEKAKGHDLGTLLYAPHPRAGLGRRCFVNVWVRSRSPDWSISMDIGNLDLSLLLTIKLRRNWRAKVRLLMCIEKEEERKQAEFFLRELLNLARLPDVEIIIHVGPFLPFLSQAPQGDLNILGMEQEPHFDFVQKVVDETGATCIFVRDSGQESALA